MRPNRFLPRLAFAGAIVFGAAPAAYAHAFLDHASPPVGGTVHAAPSDVRIWFSEPIEPAFSSITVVDATGHRVDTGKVETDAKDASELRIALAPLPPGTYTVRWRVISVDTHATTGNFTFRVAP